MRGSCSHLEHSFVINTYGYEERCISLCTSCSRKYKRSVTLGRIYCILTLRSIVGRDLAQFIARKVQAPLEMWPFVYFDEFVVSSRYAWVVSGDFVRLQQRMTKDVQYLRITCAQTMHGSLEEFLQNTRLQTLEVLFGTPNIPGPRDRAYAHQLLSVMQPASTLILVNKGGDWAREKHTPFSVMQKGDKTIVWVFKPFSDWDAIDPDEWKNIKRKKKKQRVNRL